MKKSTPPFLPRIIAIVGSTASGKTRFAIDLAMRFHGEIISADSRQIYRSMDIGTAKPTAEERAAVPHHLIDVKNPDEEYSVAEYKRDALRAIEAIIQKGKVPFLVGGTGLYIDAVVKNFDMPAVKADPQLRAAIEEKIKNEGLPAIFKKLITLDPEAEHVVDPKNPRRIVRALEVALSTGKPFTAQRKINDPLFSSLTLGVNPGEKTMRERINARVDRMMEEGLVREVKDLVAQYSPNQTAFDSIGYREVINFLNGARSQEETTTQIKMNTWHYAKRQMTWFKKDKTIHWLDLEKNPSELVEKFLQ